jgi:hypothetical protein
MERRRDTELLQSKRRTAAHICNVERCSSPAFAPLGGRGAALARVALGEPFGHDTLFALRPCNI